jgi:hypothetical protein
MVLDIKIRQAPTTVLGSSLTFRKAEKQLRPEAISTGYVGL